MKEVRNLGPLAGGMNIAMATSAWSHWNGSALKHTNYCRRLAWPLLNQAYLTTTHIFMKKHFTNPTMRGSDKKAPIQKRATQNGAVTEKIRKGCRDNKLSLYVNTSKQNPLRAIKPS